MTTRQPIPRSSCKSFGEKEATSTLPHPPCAPRHHPLLLFLIPQDEVTPQENLSWRTGGQESCNHGAERVNFGGLPRMLLIVGATLELSC
ncbi:hypothetical protein Trydic_g22828 [Trypoxylus dichotomus]